MNEIMRPDWDLLENLVKSAKRSLLICSPWIATAGLSRLIGWLKEMPTVRDIEIEFWTRLSDAQTDSPGLLTLSRELIEKGCKVALLDATKLHAKVYLADDTNALIGSANLSNSGFQTSLELIEHITHPSSIGQLRSVLNELRHGMQEVSLDQLASFIQAQRPQILELDRQKPDVSIVPLWRNIRRLQEKQRTETFKSSETGATSDGLSLDSGSSSDEMSGELQTAHDDAYASLDSESWNPSPSIIPQLAEKTGISEMQLKDFFISLGQFAAEQLGSDGPQVLLLPGLFKLKTVFKPATKAIQGINPFTKEPMMIHAMPARRVLKAQLSSRLKQVL